eukprot:CAMPEP_0183421798 /NCGR_PEP_ID=MMETSP0370-20130417/27352_1 /TAXON_ID=268820 /ORGANISM="Peridinium aciculiferum, Strain PAER-2" /LENGTH=46 /DNA_ID= /DNA_START= /DNA_END= /DNA_ORIENTATION=
MKDIITCTGGNPHNSANDHLLSSFWVASMLDTVLVVVAEWRNKALQ